MPALVLASRRENRFMFCTCLPRTWTGTVTVGSLSKTRASSTIAIEELLQTCAGCNGSGRLQQEPGDYLQVSGECQKCHGARRLLTEQGRVLKEFIDFIKAHPWLH
jgi:hypothetical protein